MPRPKRVAFVKEAPLTSQNDQRARTRSTERFDTDNRKRKSCTICNGPHTNLVYCPRLPMFVPAGNISKAIPRGLCKVCLFTGFTEGFNYRHSTVSSWKKSYCESEGCIICSVEHVLAINLGNSGGRTIIILN